MSLYIQSTQNSAWHIVSTEEIFSSVASSSSRPHELQHTRPPCPSPAPGVYSNSCPLSLWALSKRKLNFHWVMAHVSKTGWQTMAPCCLLYGLQVNKSGLYIWNGWRKSKKNNISWHMKAWEISLSMSINEHWNTDSLIVLHIVTAELSCCNRDLYGLKAIC